MKVRDFYSTTKPQKKYTAKPSLYDVYRDDKKLQKKIDDLNEVFEGKRSQLERAVESLNNSYAEIDDLDNKLDLSYDQLGIVWETYQQVLQEIRLSKMDEKEIQENIDTLNSTVQQKLTHIEELDNNEKLAEYELLIEETDALTRKTNEQKDFLESLEKNIAAKEEDMASFNRTYQNKINLLNALEIQIQEKQLVLKKSEGNE